jgi:hypothetical protein
MLAKRIAVRRMPRTPEPVITPSREVVQPEKTLLYTAVGTEGSIPKKIYGCYEQHRSFALDGYEVILSKRSEQNAFIATHFSKQILDVYEILSESEKLRFWAACILYKYGGICMIGGVDGVQEAALQKESDCVSDFTVAVAGSEAMRCHILRTFLRTILAPPPPLHDDTEKDSLSKESILVKQPLTPPTFVFAWTQLVANREQTTNRGFWGLGDALRGILSLYQFCKKNRYEFVVDTHRHPFSCFLEMETHLHHRTMIETTVTFEGDDGGSFETLKLNLKKGDIRHVFCNAYPVEPLLSDEKHLIRSILSVKKAYRLDLPANYSVLHVRAGDSTIDGLMEPKKLASYISLVKKYLTEGDVFCSDSVELKRHVAISCPGVRVFINDRRNGHVGRDTDPALLQNTLDDLQIVLGAKRVFTYSAYSWVSGFVDWGTKCFDIPLIDVKKIMV